MKIKCIVGLLITMSALAFTSGWAQSGGDSGGGGGGSVISLPIQSVDAVREFAIKNVVRGARSVQSESLNWNYPGSITYTNVTGNGAEDVLDKLVSVELVYQLTNPNDSVRGYIWLYDKDDNLLFFGSAEYLASSIGREKPSYNVWMQNIPMLLHVQSAEILALDEDGKTARRYRLDVNENGQLLFPPWNAGAPNGILAVRFTDGSLVTYNLANATGSVPGQTAEGVSDWKIEGHHVFSSGNVKVLESWLRPTVLVKLSSEQTLTVNVMGLVQKDGKTYFERPKSMVVTVGNDEDVVLLNSDGPTVFENVPARDYRFRFEWENFGQPNTLYTGPEYDGSGKG